MRRSICVFVNKKTTPYFLVQLLRMANVKSTFKHDVSVRSMHISIYRLSKKTIVAKMPLELEYILFSS